MVVVGAGAAGLAAAATLKRRGYEPLVLEEDERVGETWARRYDRLCLHTVRRFSGLPYRPLPRALPKYVSKDEYARYLADYAESFGLDVRLGSRVDRIAPQDGALVAQSHKVRRWLVGTSGGDFTARAVVVATGKHNRKRLPRWPGLGDFAGRVVHSADYSSGRDYAGQRALVVGIGNSGAEIATDLVEQGAASVSIAVRTPPPIARRDIFGVPVQILGMLLMPFPPRPVDRLGAVVRRLGTGDLRPYGLADAAWGPFVARRPPVIDVGFLETLKRGQIQVRPGVERLTRSGAVFSDGVEEPFEVVVAAIGFTTALEDVLNLPDALDGRGMPRARDDGSCAYRGLYFVGFKETPRGALFEANRDSRRLARSVARYLAGAEAKAA